MVDLSCFQFFKYYFLIRTKNFEKTSAKLETTLNNILYFRIQNELF